MSNKRKSNKQNTKPKAGRTSGNADQGVPNVTGTPAVKRTDAGK